jgi:AcrR family transcriptional regulator
MRAPSLYTHFESKNAIYDAMFGQAWIDFERIARAELSELPPNPRAAIRRVARVFFDYTVANPARHQLMNQRTIPGFEPSADSYAPAIRMFELGQQIFRNVGLTDPSDFDIFTAISAGLVSQQLANDPGGTRWSALLDRTIDVWADGLGLPPEPPAQSPRATQPRRSRRQTPATGASHDHHRYDLARSQCCPAHDRAANCDAAGRDGVPACH